MRVQLLGCAALFVAACAKNPSPSHFGSDSDLDHSAAASKDDEASSAGANAISERVVQQLIANFQRVHFDTDSSSISQAGRAALDENAAILQSYTTIRIEVQGHADERGTIDYNIALGQRRAEAVTHYLSRLGVAPSRLHATSFGEERPLQSGHGEATWSTNRRAEFLLTWGGHSSVRGTVPLL